MAIHLSMATPAVPLESVYALVLERASKNSGQATVLLRKREFELDQFGDPITTVAQLTDAVVAHLGHPLPYRNEYDGEPLAFEEDPRDGGSSEDSSFAPAKQLRQVEELKAIYRIDASRRGDAGEANPYFVLVTRKAAAQSRIPDDEVERKLSVLWARSSGKIGSVYLSSLDVEYIDAQNFEASQTFADYDLHLNNHETCPSIVLPQAAIDDIHKDIAKKLENQAKKRRSDGFTTSNEVVHIPEELRVHPGPYTIGLTKLESEAVLIQPLASCLFCDDRNLAKLTQNVQTFTFIDCYNNDIMVIDEETPDMLMLPRANVASFAHLEENKQEITPAHESSSEIAAALHDHSADSEDDGTAIVAKTTHCQEVATASPPTRRHYTTMSNVALIVEVEAAHTMNTAASRKQVLKCMKLYLANNAMRRRIWGLMTDLCSGTLFLMERDSRRNDTIDGYNVIPFNTVTGSAFVSLLKELLNKPLDAFYDATTAHVENESGVGLRFTYKGRLGFGAFGRVLHVADPFGREFALKIPIKRSKYSGRCSDMTTEWKHTNAVLGCKHAQTTVRLVFGRRLSGQPARPQYLLCEPVGKQDSSLWTRDLVLELLQGLKEIHARQVVHRDIRPSNIILAEDERGRWKLVLIDWGCALNRGEVRAYAGARAYAAHRLYDGWLQKHEGDPSDDVSSLLLTAFSAFYGAGDVAQCQGGHVSIEEQGPFWLRYWRDFLPESCWNAYQNMPLCVDGDPYEVAAEQLTKFLGRRPGNFVYVP